MLQAAGMHKLLSVSFAALLLCAAPVMAQAAEIETNGTTISVHGQLNSGDALQVKVKLDAAEAWKHPFRVLEISSPGGLLMEGRSLAAYVQDYHLDVVVPSGAICESACFLPFAAATHKTYGGGAQIGVHSATKNIKSDDDGVSTLIMARDLADYGVPEAIIGRMVITKSREMAVLSGDDLKSMGAVAMKQAPAAKKRPIPVYGYLTVPAVPAQ